jgi:hypothetical protein
MASLSVSKQLSPGLRYNFKMAASVTAYVCISSSNNCQFIETARVQGI